LKAVLGETDGWIISSPEYNGFISPLLLNAYTWCSRGDKGTMYATFAEKSATVLAASPGAMGGLRTLNPHRELLTNLGVTVLPQSVAIGAAYKAFNAEDGNLVDPRQQSMLQGAVEALFYQARDHANREATCALVKDAMLAGEYGAVSLPQ